MSPTPIASQATSKLNLQNEGELVSSCTSGARGSKNLVVCQSGNKKLSEPNRPLTQPWALLFNYTVYSPAATDILSEFTVSGSVPTGRLSKFRCVGSDSNISIKAGSRSPSTKATGGLRQAEGPVEGFKHKGLGIGRGRTEPRRRERITEWAGASATSRGHQRGPGGSNP
jgi:hypothetical protein